MVHDYNTQGKKQELVVKMNQESQMKDMENNILSSITVVKTMVSHQSLPTRIPILPNYLFLKFVKMTNH